MHRGRKLKQKASTYLGEISRTSLLQILAQPRLAPRCILAAPLPAPPLSLTLMAGRMEVESPQHTRVSTRHTPEHMRCFARVTGCGPSKLRELTLKFPSHEDLEQASEADFRKVPKVSPALAAKLFVVKSGAAGSDHWNGELRAARARSSQRQLFTACRFLVCSPHASQPWILSPYALRESLRLLAH